ncbi:hypothetical protein FRB95_001183 [Tulasnella sp. JGI-2019a]|nr:hypothetical protein FRB95_001183 [Tulasnella sp. JGI-2019a]
MLGTLKTPILDAPKEKRKKWPQNVKAGADTEAGEEFMDGNLADDLQSLVKSLKLPEAAVKYAAGTDDGGVSKEKRKEKGKALAPKAQPKTESARKIKPEVMSEISQPSSSKPVAPLPNKHFKWQHDDKKVVLPPNAPPVNRKGSKQRAIIEPMPRWYTSVPPLEPLSSVPQPTTDFIQNMREKAENLLKDEAAFAESGSANVPASMGSSDKAFLSKMISSGTSSDRLSALTLIAQSSPVHNQRALETLKGMAGKKGREESLKALRAIVDLWVGGMAPERKLRYFVDQNLTHPAVGDKHLILWAFEDWLKKYFFSLLQILESFTANTLPYVRTQALNLIYILLRDRPEQEQNLLKLLANKLGDTDKSVSAKVSYFLLQLLQQHPQMKVVVVREVSALILRPTAASSGASSSSSSSTTATLHARYYGILTFNQIVLTPQEKDVAQLLTTLYFELFVMILGSPIEVEAEEADDEGGENKNGDVGKSSTGDKKKKSDRRAPLPRDRRKLKERAERDVNKGGNTGPIEMTVGDAGFGEVEDGHSKMIAGILTGLNRALPFARMEETIFEQHVDTLFRITHSATFNVSIQALVLILQVSASRQSISDRFYRTLYESLLDPRLVMSSKQAMYLNLLFKAAKLDTNHGRLCAFVKRFLQALGMHQPSFICGALFLLGELFDLRPELRKMARPEGDANQHANESSVSHPGAAYDPRKRDPQFANASNAPLWEIVPLLHHFHPSVALHARQILDGEKVTTTADLSLNTVSQFLDRFVYKNAKKPTARGASLMQPGTVEGGTGLVRQLRGVGDVGNLNEESFWNKPVEKVPVDQLFFHKFFSLRKRTEKVGSKSRKKRGDEDELNDDEDEDEDESAEGSVIDESDGEEEAEIWKAMKKSLPKGDRDIEDMDEDDDSSIPDDFDASEDDLPDNSGDGSGTESEETGADIDDEDVVPLEFSDMDGVQDGDGGSSGTDDDAWEGVSGVKRKKGKDEKGKDDAGSKKKKRKVALPTFASYDDYAKMIDEAGEEGEDK